MSSRHKRFAACILAALVLAAAGCAQVVSRPDVLIATARPADVDYPLGASICRLFNLEFRRHGLRCAEEPSAGAAANLESLHNGRVDVGIVPSDVLAGAVAAQEAFASPEGAGELRVLFAGHADIFTLVVHRASGIRSLADLRGRRVGIGSPGSRQSTGMARAMAAFGLETNDFSAVREASPAEQNRAFCADELDALVYSVGHPHGLIRHAAVYCRGVLVDVRGPQIERMLLEYGEYERAAIPGGTYPANPADVHTFGVRAVVVATTSMPDPVAYEIARAVFERFEDFRRLHPAFEPLSVKRMVQATGPAPLHAGAARYYRERGWLP